MRRGRFIGARPGRNLAKAASIAIVIVVASTSVASFRTIASSGTVYGGQTSSAATVGSGPPEPCSGCTIADLLPPLDAIDAGFFPACALTDVSDQQKCVVGSPGSHDVIAVFGDSFAWHWMPAFDEVARTHGIRLLNLVRLACPPGVVPVWSVSLKRTDTDCDPWREQALRRI